MVEDFKVASNYISIFLEILVYQLEDIKVFGLVLMIVNHA